MLSTRRRLERLETDVARIESCTTTADAALAKVIEDRTMKRVMAKPEFESYLPAISEFGRYLGGARQGIDVEMATAGGQWLNATYAAEEAQVRAELAELARRRAGRKRGKGAT